MTFLDYLGVTFGHNPTPEELHQRIEQLQRLDDPIYVSQAGEEAIAFADDGANYWLLEADKFIRDSVQFATETARARPYRIPEAGRAIVVPASCEGDRYPWAYASDVAKENLPVEDRCSRCYLTSALLGGPVLVPIRDVFIASGRFVVHFTVCLDCLGHYSSLADRVVRRSTVAGERLDIDMTDKDHGDGTV